VNVGVFIFAFGLLAASDAPVTVSVALDPPIIPYHKQAKFSIVIEAPAGIEVKAPDMSKVFGQLEMAGFPDTTTEDLDEGRKRVTTVYTLEAILAADYPLAPLTVTWGENGSATVPCPALQVRELTEEERVLAEHFEPNAGLPAVGGGFWNQFGIWIGLAALTGAVIGAALYWRFVRTRTPVPVVPPTPWEIAYGRLRDLDKRKLPQLGRFDQYYVELSDVLRRYIEDQLHLRAPEQTTPEFLAAASNSGKLTEEQQVRVAAFLRHCDRVKFARHEPSLNEMEQHFTEVLAFVDETVPKPEPVEVKAA
jgi:hypothetical protein